MIRSIVRFFWENVRDVRWMGAGILIRYAKSIFAGIYSVSVRGFGRMYIRKGSSDLAVLRQVFCDRQYELADYPQFERIKKRYDDILKRGAAPLIIDAGANNGSSAIWFASKFPRAQIAAIEPDPDNYALCRRNTQARGSISVHEAAIGGTAGFVTLQNPGSAAWAVQTTREGTGKKIPILTVDEIVNTSGSACELFIAKIDIEGFESDLFAHNTQWLQQAMVVMIEPHDWLLPGKFTSLSFQRAIAGYRYEMLLRGENLIYVHE